MSNLCWLTDEQIERLRPFFPKSHGKPRGGRPAGAERHRIRQPQWAALARCTQRVRPAQDAVQSVKALGRGRCVHANDGRSGCNWRFLTAFLTGFIGSEDTVYGRPRGIAVGKDGSLLIADDAGGTLWRVSMRQAASQ